MQEVKVGTRVMFKKTGIRGTIIGFVLDSRHPFHVRWDKNTDDWYGAADLSVLPPEKVVDPVDEHLDMLRGFIDGENDDVALMLQPLVDFLINLKSAKSASNKVDDSTDQEKSVYPLDEYLRKFKQLAHSNELGWMFKPLIDLMVHEREIAIKRQEKSVTKQ